MLHACYEMAVKEKTNNTNQKTCLCLKKDFTERDRLKTINKHDMNMKVKVKVAQPYPTLCNPMDCVVHGILQARILKWVACPFSRGSSQPRDQIQVSCIAGKFFTNWAIREAPMFCKRNLK